MARDIFAEDFEDKTEGAISFDNFGKKIGVTLLERASLIMAGLIMLVVVVVMTSDIKVISIKDVTELSLSAFVLIFCSYSMYGNMYHSGMIAGKKLKTYKTVTDDYARIRAEVKDRDVMKQLTLFCKEYIDDELKSRREAVLEIADVSWEEYLECRHLSKRELQYDKKLSKVKIKAISDANWIVPIKLEPTMIYRPGGRAVRRSPMHTAPGAKRTFDFVFNFLKTGATSLCMCFIAFELFAEPTWEMLCAVAIKLLTVALNGWAGYRRGYDNIAIDTVNYTEDQIDLLEQYKVWRGSEEVFSTVASVPVIEGAKI